MFRTILKRLMQTLVVVFLLESFAFFAVRAMPGGPFSADRAIPEHIKAQTEAAFGLDKSKLEQFFIFWKKLLLEGDLGPSTSLFGRSVMEVITQTFPVSLGLGICAMIVGVGLGIPLGIFAALRKNGIVDYVSMIIALGGICIPAFVLGPLLQVLIARNFVAVNVAGLEKPIDLVLPAITLGIGVAAYVARLTRGGMLDVLSQDYIRTAIAKGVAPRNIVIKHALRGALTPAITYLGPAFASIITGSFVVETIFQVPGMGQHFVTAVTSKDYFIVQGLVLFYGILMGGANLLVDLVLAAINPRLRN